MDDVERTTIRQKRMLEAYGTARPMLEKYKNDPIMLKTIVELVWEHMSARNRLSEMAELMDAGWQHMQIALQKFEELPPESDKTDNPRLVVAWNVNKTETACGVCGKPAHRVEIGPELFQEGTEAPVCERCGQVYAPEMMELLKVLRHNPGIVSVLEQMKQATLRRKTGDF